MSSVNMKESYFKSLNFNFVKRLREFRVSTKLTQAQFATRIGVKPSYISKIEAGKQMPSALFIKSVCYEFGVTQEWLVDGEGDPVPEPVKESEEPFIDFELLTEVITGIERFLRSEDLELDPKPKARLIVILYDRFHSAKERPQKRVIQEYLKLAS